MSTKTKKGRRHRSITKAQYLLRLALLVLVCAAVLGGLIYLVSRPKNRNQPEKPGESTSTPTSFPSSASSADSSAMSSSSETVALSSAASVSSTTSSSSTTSGTKTTTSSRTSGITPTSPTSANTAGHYVQKSGAPWNLLLVNAWNPIDKNFEKSIAMSRYGSTDKYLFDERAIEELKQMMKDAGSLNLYPVSFYRSRETQDTLFKRKIQRLKNSGYTGSDIEEKAATVVARPGTSEHQTGLAADILGSGYSTLTSGFDKTKAFQWLKEHCAEYGFILRYPKEKQPITGVIYEPWHYRYVGKEHATAIMKQGVCLEEYLEQLEKQQITPGTGGFTPGV